jgi:hypothetical protein
MANTVYSVKDITLQDDTDITLRPNSIKLQREFMKAFNKMEQVKTEDEGYDVFMDLASICLRRQLITRFEEDITKGPGAKKYKEYLEDVLDMETIYEVLDVCGGIKVDPKAIAQAQMAAETAMREAGTA